MDSQRGVRANSSGRRRSVQACRFSATHSAHRAVSGKTFRITGSILLATLSCAYTPVLCAQTTESPEYAAAKQAAISNWTNPPLSATAGKDVVGVLTRDANELNAAKALYKSASPAVQGAVDGSLLQASAVVKISASTIASGHHCELTPLPATADPLTRAASEITDASICLGGQPAETLGHKIANNGNIRALERQFTFGLAGHGDKQAALTKATDPKTAGAVDFAVQQVINNFSKNDIAAEIAREREASQQGSQAVSKPPGANR